MLYEYTGNYSDFLRQKAKRQAVAEQEENKRLSYIRREADWIARGPKARGTKAQARVDRFYDAVNQSALQREEDVDIVIPPAPRLSNRVVTFEHVDLDIAGRSLVRDFSFDFEAGMRIGVVGRNGMGKTTLLRAMLGEVEPARGEITVGPRTVFNYADQHRVVLNDEKTVFEEIGEGNDFVQLGNHRTTLWAYLKRFLFTDDEIHTQVGQLSGGERSRLVLAKILKRGGNMLLLDEPTNDLDLATLRVLETGLAEFGGCVVVVSHDRYLLNRVCNGIFAFEGDGQVTYQPGDYDYYLQKRREALKQQTPDEPTPEEKKSVRAPVDGPTVRKLKWKEERELEGMEDAVLDVETEIERLETLFSQEDFFDRHGHEVKALTDDLEQAKQTLERLYERWEELEAIKHGEVVE